MTEFSLEVVHVAVGLGISVVTFAVAMYTHAGKAAAREALQNREIEDLKKWRAGRSEKVFDLLREMQADIHGVSERLAALEGKLE